MSVLCFVSFSIKSRLYAKKHEQHELPFHFSPPRFPVLICGPREKEKTQSGSLINFTCVALHSYSFSLFCTKNDASSVFFRNVFTIRTLFIHYRSFHLTHYYMSIIPLQGVPCIFKQAYFPGIQDTSVSFSSFLGTFHFSVPLRRNSAGRIEI